MSSAGRSRVSPVKRTALCISVSQHKTSIALGVGEPLFAPQMWIQLQRYVRKAFKVDES